MPDAPAPERNPAGFNGLRESAAAVFGAVAQYLHARLLLARAEAGEAFGAWLKLLVCIVAALLLLLFAYIGLVAGIVAWVISAGLAVHWTILAAAGLHLIGAIVILLIGKAKFAVAGFSESIEEFRKDQQWLAAKKSTKPANG